MSISWTDDQKKVIDTRERNLLVSAAAGSGKTAVLVERILTMITDETRPVDVDRLLITTFTDREGASEAPGGGSGEYVDPEAGGAGVQSTDHHNSRILSLCNPELFSYNWFESQLPHC